MCIWYQNVDDLLMKRLRMHIARRWNHCRKNLTGVHGICLKYMERRLMWKWISKKNKNYVKEFHCSLKCDFYFPIPLDFVRENLFWKVSLLVLTICFSGYLLHCKLHLMKQKLIVFEKHGTTLSNCKSLKSFFSRTFLALNRSWEKY